MRYYESDLDLLAEVRKYGKFDVTGCFNCGSCTLSCELANDQASFPRKSVRHVVMGLKGLLHESLEPWVCHDCGDCSIACPRETKPQESMMTLRRYLTSVYDWTGIASLINRSKGWHIATLSLAAALVLLLTGLYHIYWVKMPFSDFTSTYVGLEHMFPIMTYFTLVVILIPLLILVSNAFRMYGLTAPGSQNGPMPVSHRLSQIKTFLVHFFTYKKMAECPTGKSRWLEHLFIGIGCLMMLAVKVFGLRWFQTDHIYPVFHPQRWLGYLATALLLYGTGSILLGRITKEKEVYKSSEFADWTFLVLLFATALSGIVLHAFRLLGLEVGTCYTYAIHVTIATPMLVIEMPFGKWTHMVYRPLAVSLQTLSLKERSLEQQWSSKEVTEYVA